MSRVSLACAAPLAITLVLAAGPAGASAAVPPRAALQSPSCERASNQLNRSISITADMRPMSGTERMRLKFQLLRKTDNRAFAPVSGGDLGKWISPTNPPTLGQRPDDNWVLRKEVVNLEAPAAYRFRVIFRWIGSSGQPIATTLRRGPICYQS